MGVSGRQGRRGKKPATSAVPRATGRTGRARADRGRSGALRVLLPRQKPDSADLLRGHRFLRRAAQLRVRGDAVGGALRTAAVRFSGGRRGIRETPGRNGFWVMGAGKLLGPSALCRPEPKTQNPAPV